jgi:hypothetical protein
LKRPLSLGHGARVRCGAWRMRRVLGCPVVFTAKLMKTASHHSSILSFQFPHLRHLTSCAEYVAAFSSTFKRSSSKIELMEYPFLRGCTDKIQIHVSVRMEETSAFISVLSGFSFRKHFTIHWACLTLSPGQIVTYKNHARGWSLYVSRLVSKFNTLNSLPLRNRRPKFIRRIRTAQRTYYMYTAEINDEVFDSNWFTL